MDTPTAMIDFEGPPASPDPGRRRLAFERPLVQHMARRASEVGATLAAAEAAALDGRWVVGFVAYEAAPAFDPALAVRGGCGTPLAWFGVYRAPIACAPPGRTACFPPPGRHLPEGWVSSEDARRHAKAVGRIRDAIEAGDVYQVNHTLRLTRPLDTPARVLYDRWFEATPAPYSAYLDLGAQQILSISPELFFRRIGRRVETRPMKGTAPRGRWSGEDDERALGLAASMKDRAENLMIVDLVRNDLGRVARFGGVEVTELFRVERHATVHQMVSAIHAELAAGVGLPELFSSLFPCGSVTGAPKIAATRLIAELESTPRGAYCGAVGVIAPGGDCAFNVAIRTAVADGARGSLTYGVGGGVTWASTPEGEWREAVGKAAILHPAVEAAALVETLRVERGAAIRWEGHRRRLLASADVLGHRIRPGCLDGAVDEAVRSCGGETRILRLVAERDGAVRWRTRALASRSDLSAALARHPIDPADPRLYHKTADRGLYEAARAGLEDGIEPLLWNPSGHLTEFARGNLVVGIDGRRVTPPIRAGLLPGVYRDELVRTGRVEEADVLVSDLERARDVWFVNSAREWVRVGNPVANAGVGH